MFKLKELLKPQMKHHLILVVILVVYILMNVETPEMMAPLVNNLFGKIVIVLIVLGLFKHCESGPLGTIIGVVGLIAAYELIRRSSDNVTMLKYLPSSEKKKIMDFEKYNEFPKTLEEEVVSKMAPLVSRNSSSNSNFKPVLDKLYDAAPVDFIGVV